jgi:general secretion pathway protein H
MRVHGRCGGFSLIEILVVIVIIGIVMSIAMLSITLAGGDNQLRDEAQRIMSLVEVARDESLLQGREFGLEFMQDSYRFVEAKATPGRARAGVVHRGPAHHVEDGSRKDRI